MDEFIDTYSDDLITLIEGREALLTHPLRSEISDYVDASTCRLFLVFMIGSIEAMLESWLDRDNMKILEKYFAKDVKNGDRIHSLKQAFIDNGINVKEEVFNDYLAAKYLRNRIVHASWENQSGKPVQHEIDWIEQRGFVTDTRKLTSDHLQRFEWVNQNMMLYIAIAGMPDFSPRPDKEDVGVDPQPKRELSGIIGIKDWPAVHWNNLDRISAKIGEVITEVLCQPEYDWTKGLDMDEFNTFDPSEKKKIYYRAAQDASESGCAELEAQAGLVDDAIFNWLTYQSLYPDAKDLDLLGVSKATLTLNKLHQSGLYQKDGFFPPLSDEIPNEDARKLITALLGDTGKIEPLDIYEAHILGSRSKQYIKNICPVSLFSVQLPLIAHNRQSEIRELALQIMDIFDLGNSWYSFVERRERPQAVTEFYREMLDELLGHKGEPIH